MSKCVVGASVDGGEEEAANEEERPEGVEPKNTFSIYGTVKNPEEYKKTDFVKEIIKVIKQHISKKIA